MNKKLIILLVILEIITTAAVVILLYLAATSKSAQAAELIQKTDGPVYCGPAGGYPESAHKFPIETRAKARAALSYAHWADNPDGIRKCVCEHYPDFPSCLHPKQEKLNDKDRSGIKWNN
jgi:hypothetical protein